MKIFSFVFFISSCAFFAGCANSPTSPNGSGWQLATNNAFGSGGGRYGLAGTVFGNAMWAMGGASSNASASVTTYYSDVWSSGTGSSWTKATAAAPFGGRFGSQALSYNGLLWLIAGNQQGTFKNDVWNTSDGANWTTQLANGPATTTQFSAREDFGAVVFNNLMWVIGGASTTGALNDVWNSPDGITWTKVLAAGPTSATHFNARWGFAIAVYNNLIWILGGASQIPTPSTAFSDVWNSPDGITWTKVASVAPFGTTYFQQAGVFNNLLWLTAGEDIPWGPNNTVMDTSDGINWVSNQSPPYPVRFDDLTLSFSNHLWIIGGMNNTLTRTYYNDVWVGP